MAKGAAVLNATTDYIDRSGNLPTGGGAYSVGGWFRFDTLTSNTSRVLFQLRDAAGDVEYVRFEESGDTFVVGSNGSETAMSPTTPTTGTWYYFGMSAASGDNHNMTIYWFDWNAGSVRFLDSAVQASLLTGFAPARIRIMSNYSSSPTPGLATASIPGAAAQVRFWDRALSQSDFAAEAASTTIVSSTNINFAFEDDPTNDISGNNRDCTVSSVTVSASDFPPNYPTAVKKLKLLAHSRRRNAA